MHKYQWWQCANIKGAGLMTCTTTSRHEVIQIFWLLLFGADMPSIIILCTVYCPDLFNPCNCLSPPQYERRWNSTMGTSKQKVHVWRMVQAVIIPVHSASHNKEQIEVGLCGWDLHPGLHLSALLDYWKEVQSKAWTVLTTQPSCSSPPPSPGNNPAPSSLSSLAQSFHSYKRSFPSYKSVRCRDEPIWSFILWGCSL